MSKNNDLSRWQKITLWDIGCLLYWGAFFVTFCLFFDWPIDFRESLRLTSWPRKIAVLFMFWSGSIIAIQTVCGKLGALKVIFKFLSSPLSSIRILTGFLWDSRTKINTIRKQLPTRQIFFVMLLGVILTGLTETDPTFLAVLRPATWFVLVWSLYSCFKWTLNPLPFLEQTRSLDIIVKNKSTAVQKLSEVKTTKFENAHAELLKTLENFRKVIEVLPKIINFMRGPKLLFTVFALIFVFGATTSLVLTSTILRIEHFLTPGGVFQGTFFNNTISDYFYISLNHFVSAETYNISVISPNVRFVLSSLPIVSMSLTLLLVLAFTMVGQSAVDTTFKNFGNDVLGVIDEATKKISNKPEIIVIDQRKDKKEQRKEEEKSAQPIETTNTQEVSVS